jgi:molybdate transport repressor ModE-like protein
MNQVSKGPMVEMSRGGAQRGAGALTAFGRKVLRLYQKIDRESGATARPDALRLARLLE